MADVALERAFRREIKGATRGSGALLGALAIVVVPAWSVVDRLLEPEHATLFIELRAACTVAMAVLLFVLVRTRVGERHPEALMLLFLLLPEIAIAVMIARVEHATAIYATGLSLGIYASAFLLVWPWRYTAALIAMTAAVVATTSVAMGAAEQLAGVAFYLGTASLIAASGQWYRHKLAWREFLSRAALEREQERNEQLLRRLERLTHEDELTGLANRRSWDAALERELAASRRTGAPLALVVCDVDRFKQVNDRHGHPAGDQVLKQVAALIADRVRASDLPARLGGDEFAILCPGTDLDDAIALARDLVAAAEGSLRADGVSGPTLSAGVAARTGEDVRAEQLVARADHALYRAKQTRNSVSAHGVVLA